MEKKHHNNCCSNVLTLCKNVLKLSSSQWKPPWDKASGNLPNFRPFLYGTTSLSFPSQRFPTEFNSFLYLFDGRSFHLNTQQLMLFVLIALDHDHLERQNPFIHQPLVYYADSRFQLPKYSKTTKLHVFRTAALPACSISSDLILFFHLTEYSKCSSLALRRLVLNNNHAAEPRYLVPPHTPSSNHKQGWTVNHDVSFCFL